MVRERNTAWLETIRNFFISDEEIENEDNMLDTDKGYQDWKKANADIINENEIKNLEKMLEHKDKKRRKEPKPSLVETAKTTQVRTTCKETEKGESNYERGE